MRARTNKPVSPGRWTGSLESLERKTRFELATLALARRCSTAELLPRSRTLHVPRASGSTLELYAAAPTASSNTAGADQTGVDRSASERSGEESRMTHVGPPRLELGRLATLEPKSSASTNSATGPRRSDFSMRRSREDARSVRGQSSLGMRKA